MHAGVLKVKETEILPRKMMRKSRGIKETKWLVYYTFEECSLQGICKKISQASIRLLYFNEIPINNGQLYKTCLKIYFTYYSFCYVSACFRRSWLSPTFRLSLFYSRMWLAAEDDIKNLHSLFTREARYISVLTSDIAF